MKSVNNKGCVKAFFLFVGIGLCCCASSYIYASDDIKEKEFVAAKKVLSSCSKDHLK